MKKFIVALFIALTGFVGLCPCFGANSVPSGVGICIHFTGLSANDFDTIKNSGFDIARTDLKWAEVERTKGVYDWSIYDSLINSLISRGIRPYLILDYNNFNYGAKNELDAADTNQQVQGYTNFAKAAVERYKGKGIIWEIWNEPNIDIFWRPAPDAYNYTNLVKSAVPAMRAADPQAIIVAPAMAFIANTFTFMEDCAKEGLFGLVDAVSVHPYKNAAPETGSLDYLYDSIRNLISKYNPANPNLPIIGGEFGFSCSWPGINEQIQSQYLPRQLLYHGYKNIPISIIYDFKNDGTDLTNHEHNFGILRYDSSLKPAFNSVKSFNMELKGMKYSSRLPSSDTDYLFEYSNGSVKKVAAWTTGSPHSVNIYNKSINLTNLPVYVEQTPVTPASPSDLKVDSVTRGITTGNYYINLSWVDNSNNETGFEIQQAIDSTDNFQGLKYPAANTTKYGVNIGSNVVPGKKYYYKILAVNSIIKSQPSNTLNVIPVKLSAPSLSGKTGNIAILEWQDNIENEIGYDIYQSINTPNNFNLIKSLSPKPGTGLIREIIEITYPGTYYYKIVCNLAAGGGSLTSNTVSIIK